MRAVALRCPYCRCGFDPKDEIIRCSECRAIHHSTCWYENNHCSVFACDGHGCQSRSFRRSMEIVPPILLLLLFLFPYQMITFVPLLIPAQLCSGLLVAHFMGQIFHGDFRKWDALTQFERGLCCASNLIAIILGIFTLRG